MDLKNDDAGFFPSPQTQFEICGPKKCFFLNLGLFFFFESEVFLLYFWCVSRRFPGVYP